MGASEARILFPKEEPTIQRDEMTAGMGLIAAGVLDKIASKAEELGAADDSAVTQAAGAFTERMLILGNGLRPKPSARSLESFDKRIKDTYELSMGAIDTYVKDKYRLIDMLGRISAGIQGDMSVNKLLTTKAKQQLQQAEKIIKD